MTRKEYAELENQLARLMEPEAWAEFDRGNGVCSNQSGYKCLESLGHARIAVMFIEEKGLLP